MIFKVSRNKRILFFAIAMLPVVIPVLLTAFELISTEKESVVFLEGYPTSVSTLVLLYYLLLLIIGASWLIKNFISLFQLKNEKARTEMMHLKSQVNPHFFFNTLNNLYGMIGTDPSKAQLLTLKLSDMMRYSIYEGERDRVTLKEEVNYLQKYIELHKMRYHKEIDIQFDVQIEDDFKVMPLLFIILLENAFKHGIESLCEDAYVHLSMKTRNNEVCFTIENTFDISQPKEDNGIGLKNLKRRLELAYPKKHNLAFSVTKNLYKAQLTVQL